MNLARMQADRSVRQCDYWTERLHRLRQRENGVRVGENARLFRCYQSLSIESISGIFRK